MSDKEDSYKIFLSYSSSCISQVVRLSNFFESKGFKTWYAPRNIPAGATWYREIPPAIEKCDALVLIFCKKADESENIGDEIRIARSKKKARFYLRVEEEVFPQELDFLIGSAQWRDWFDESNETPLNEIADLIRDKLDDVRNTEHREYNRVEQSNTRHILLSEKLSIRTENFASSMSIYSALKQIRGGYFPSISVLGAVPAIFGNIPAAAAGRLAGTQSENEKPLIFLSYPNVKANEVKSIAEFLETRGFKAWYASRDVQAGAKKFEETAKAIEVCNAFICVLCPESDRRENCANELVYAVDQNKPIFTVRTENFESKRRLSLFLNRKQYIDWFDIKDYGPLEELVNTISAGLQR